MSRQARLGLVVLAGVVLFIALLFILANRTFLLSDTYSIRAEFSRVSGLQTGARVLYNGISVGRVEGINLPTSPGLPISVSMQIKDDAKHLIRTDSRAVIQTDGLVGNVIVALTDGSPSQPVVAENGRITGVDPFQFSTVTDKMFESVARFDSVTITLTNIMQDVQSGQGSLGRFMYDDRLYDETVLTAQELRGALGNIGASADQLVAIAADGASALESVIRKVDSGDGTLSRILNEDSMYVALLQSADQFQAISADLGTITERFETAAGHMAVGAFRFSENMEALKHNFLFKGYFEDRGYLELAPFEIREQAISETYEDLQRWERELYLRELEMDRRESGSDETGAAPSGGSD